MNSALSSAAGARIGNPCSPKLRRLSGDGIIRLSAKFFVFSGADGRKPEPNEATAIVEVASQGRSEESTAEPT